MMRLQEKCAMCRVRAMRQNLPHSREDSVSFPSCLFHPDGSIESIESDGSDGTTIAPIPSCLQLRKKKTGSVCFFFLSMTVETFGKGRIFARCVGNIDAHRFCTWCVIMNQIVAG